MLTPWYPAKWINSRYFAVQIHTENLVWFEVVPSVWVFRLGEYRMIWGAACPVESVIIVPTPCYSVMQSVAECCRVLRVLRCVAVWCSVLQCVAVCCNVSSWWYQHLLRWTIEWPRPVGCRSFPPKEPQIKGFFCGKWPLKIRHPMDLRDHVYKCVCVCIRTCVYIHKYKSDILLHTNTYTHKHTYTHTQRLPSSNMAKTPFLMSSNCSLLAAAIAYIYIYIYMYVCIYIHTHIYLQICIHTYIYVYIFICI